MKKRVVSIITSVFLLMTIFAVPTFAAEQYQPKSDSYTWTEWSTSAPPSGANYETKIQYRYRDKSYITNGYRDYSGYTRSATTLVSKSYGGWYLSARATSDTPSSTYRTIVSNETKTAYYSYCYVCDHLSWFWKNANGSHGGCKTKNIFKVYSSKRLAAAGYKADSDGSYPVEKTMGSSYPGKFGTVYLSTYNGERVAGLKSSVANVWLWKGGGDDTRTMYRAVTKKYQYTHWKWGSWSSYSDSYVSSSSNREVQTRTLYRYKVYDQTISGASTFNKTYGNSAFSLGASAKTGLTYSSSNSDIAAVSSNGTVTIKSAGTVTITIKAAASSIYNSAVKYVTVNIAKASPNLSYTGATTINKTYSTATFSVAATAKNGVQYSSSNINVLTVSKTGVVTLKNAGTAVINIKTPSSNKYNVQSTSVTVNVAKASQTIGSSFGAKVTRVCSSTKFSLGATSKTARTYSSSNITVATVDADGKVKLKNPGTAVITITAAENGKYNAATKTITFKATLKKPTMTAKKGTVKKQTILNFKVVQGTDGYVVYRSTKKNSGFVAKYRIVKTKTVNKYAVQLRKYNKSTGKYYWQHQKYMTGLPTIKDTGLIRGKTYYYKVKVYDEDTNTSKMSDRVSAVAK